MKPAIRPTPAEVEFLTLSYNRFYDIFDEVIADSFVDKDNWYRFSRIKEAFTVYTELLNYEPIKWVIEHLKKARPPMEADKKRMTYLSINFPDQYDDTTNIYLKDFLTEEEGIKFSFILMRQIVDTQVENNETTKLV